MTHSRGGSLLRMTGVVKHVGGLRPLRVADLSLGAGQRLAIVGVDGPGAEALVNLATGAALPDEGDVALFGVSTTAITDPDAWLRSLDQCGLVSPRALLLDEVSLAANVALAFTLSIDPMATAVWADVRRLAAEVGLSEHVLAAPTGPAAPLDRARCHLARALASAPRLLILEHASALAGDAVVAFAETIASVARARRLPWLALAADESFARALGGDVLRLDPATGRLIADSRWQRWMKTAVRTVRGRRRVLS